MVNELIKVFLEVVEFFILLVDVINEEIHCWIVVPRRIRGAFVISCFHANQLFLLVMP